MVFVFHDKSSINNFAARERPFVPFPPDKRKRLTDPRSSSASKVRLLIETAACLVPAAVCCVTSAISLMARASVSEPRAC
ncbi:MAG: hypothetical protein KDE56_32180, partial [Anaerolineales bacterium]|nr:hypothetical protein [Anaerolineales bacterium]